MYKRTYVKFVKFAYINMNYLVMFWMATIYQKDTILCLLVQNL